MPRSGEPRSVKLSSKKSSSEGELRDNFLQSEPTVEEINSQYTQPAGDSFSLTPNEPNLTPEMKADLDHEVEMSQKYDKPLKAAAIGAAQGLIPGANHVLKKFGFTNEEIKETQERSPWAHGAGELAGFAAGAAIPGIGEEKAIGGASELLGKFSLGGGMNASEKALAPIIAKAFKNKAEQSLAREIVQKGITKGLAAAPAGAALGINDLLNESAIGDAELNGQNLIAHAGVGAVLNGIAGGAFGAIEASTPLVSSAFDKATGQMKRVFEQELDPIKAITSYVTDSPIARADLKQSLKSVEEGDIQTLLRDKVQFAKSETPSTLASKLETAKADVGAEIKAKYKQIDEALPAGVVPSTELHNELQQSLDNFVKNNRNYFDSKASKATYSQIKNELDSRAGRLKGVESANSTWDFVKTLGDKGKSAFGADNDATLKARMYADLNRAARDVLQRNIEASTVNTPIQGVLSEIRSLNGQFRTASLLSSVIDSKAAKENGFKDLHGALFALSGLAMGHPVSAIGGLIGKKLLESDTRRKLVILNYLQRSAKEGESKIASAISGFFNKGKGAADLLIKAGTRAAIMESGFAHDENKTAPKNQQEAFKNIQKNITELKVQPDILAYKIASNTMKAGYAAPNSIKMAQITLSTAVNFLESKMPKNINHGADITGEQDWKPSDQDMAKFGRYLQAVENPYSVLTDLKKGTITSEHVEALQTVYPAIYQQIKSKMLDGIKDNKVPYNRKVQMGILFDAPTTSSLNPSTIQTLQSGFAATPQQQSNQQSMVKPTQGGASKLGVSQRTATPMQQAAGGIEE